MSTLTTTGSTRRNWGPLVSCGLLLSAICGAAHADTVIDSVPGANGAVPIFTNWSRGITFTTGGGVGTQINGLDVLVNGDNGATAPYSFSVGLYAASGGKPTGSLLGSATVNVPTLVSGNSLVSPTSLGSLGTYTLGAFTQYSLIVYNSTTFGFFLGTNNTSVTTTNGYVVNNGLFTTNYTSSWDFDENVIAIQLRVPGAAPVPEIDPAGTGSILALVTGALGLLERRRRTAA